VERVPTVRLGEVRRDATARTPALRPLRHATLRAPLSHLQREGLHGTDAFSAGFRARVRGRQGLAPWHSAIVNSIAGWRNLCGAVAQTVPNSRFAIALSRG
jgi:hypothetical protein